MFTKDDKWISGAVLTWACVGMFAAAQAAVVSVNFQQGNGATVYSEMGSTGVVNAGNWNNLNETALGATNLIDNNGTATTVDLTWNMDSYYWNQIENGGPLNDFTSLFNGRFDRRSETGSLVFELSQVPYATYDVYVYYGINPVSATGPWCTIDANGLNRQQVLFSNDYTQGFIEHVNSSTPSNYVKFGGLSGSTLTIGTGAQPWEYLYITGFQIAEVPVPEPGTLVLLSGLIVCVLRRRK